MTTTSSKPKSSWRDVLPVHPAADLFPMMTPDELKKLGEDIKKNGLRNRVVLWAEQRGQKEYLLDGRNRLDAIERAGHIRLIKDGRLSEFFHRYCHTVYGPLDEIATKLETVIDPFSYVISANIHRRHLTPEQKRELVEKLIRATPEKSDRQIADEIKSNRNTVGRVRAKLEQTGDVSLSDTRTDSKGRQQPAHKPPKAAPKPAPACALDPEEAEDNPVISQCVADIRERIEQAMDEIARNEWFALTERLHEAINDVSDQRHRAVMRTTHQPDDPPDIPEFLRRRSS
jgi:hypothetical protein